MGQLFCRKELGVFVVEQNAHIVRVRVLTAPDFYVIVSNLCKLSVPVIVFFFSFFMHLCMKCIKKGCL